MLLQNKHIFVVEDDPRNLAIIRTILRENGARVSFDHWGKTALDDLVSAITDTRHIKVKSSILIDNSIRGEISLNIYRITQELINNTLKHAGAKNISIELHEVANEYLSFIYTDDGIGFNQSLDFSRLQ